MDEKTQTAHGPLVAALEDLARVQRELALAVAHEIGCQRAGLSALRTLRRTGGCTVGELAEHLRVDISVTSRQASALVDSGLVERSPGDDRRVRTLRITPAGEVFLADTDGFFDRFASAAFADWSAEEIRLAAREIAKVASAIASAHDDRASWLSPAPAEPRLRAAHPRDEQTPELVIHR